MDNPTIIKRKVPMKKNGMILVFSVIGLLIATARAVDIACQWHAEFDTQVGAQKYLFTFKTDGDKLTGKAAVEVGGEKHEAELTEGKITGDTVSFVEMLNFQGNEILIRYSGKIGTNEIDFTREVGDIATENFKAARIAPAATNASAQTQANNTAARVPQEPRISRSRRSCLARMINLRSPIRPPAATPYGTTFPTASWR